MFTKLFVKLYIQSCWLSQHYLAIHIPGMGYVQNFLKKDFILSYREGGVNYTNKYLYYNKNVIGSYDCLLAGHSNEPETPLFLQRIVPNLPECTFVEVGASIGEFVVEMSCYDNVKHIYAFEPRKECVKALKKTVELNGDKDRVDILPYIVADTESQMTLHNNPGGTSSGIYGEGDDFYSVESVTLDNALPLVMENTIMLVDVEGAEPVVLKGGKKFIQANYPLIIFEYNQVSKKHFNIDDIYSIIGNEYSIYRIKGDATLDRDFSNSWNCVAIPKNSNYEEILLK